MRNLITTLLLIFIGIVIAASVRAADVGLAWDASPTPGLITYTIYGTTNTMSSTNLHSAEVKADAGTNLTVTIRDMKPSVWTFAATANKATVSTNMTLLVLGQPTLTTNRLESEPSNFLIVEMPQPPAVMRTLVIQANGTLIGTNWFDAGFFRLKIQ